MEEQWKDIKGYESYYQVSNKGRVRSKNRRVKSRSPRNKSGFVNLKSKILKQTVPSHGYKSVALCKNNKSDTKLVHRLMAEAFIPNPEGKKCINHKNSNRLDNRINNLEWVSYKENTNHGFKYGKLERGEKASGAKLTRKQVVEIKKQIKAGVPHVEIAKDLPISNRSISDIKNGKSWTHVEI